MEAVSKNMKNPSSVISSEDMLARVGKYNIDMERKNEEWSIRKAIKLSCDVCNLEERICNQHNGIRNKIRDLEKDENLEEIKKVTKETLNE